MIGCSWGTCVAASTLVPTPLSRRHRSLASSAIWLASQCPLLFLKRAYASSVIFPTDELGTEESGSEDEEGGSSDEE